MTLVRLFISLPQIYIVHHRRLGEKWPHVRSERRAGLVVENCDKWHPEYLIYIRRQRRIFAHIVRRARVCAAEALISDGDK